VVSGVAVKANAPGIRVKLPTAGTVGPYDWGNDSERPNY
jgi:hypothetical protein